MAVVQKQLPYGYNFLSLESNDKKGLLPRR